MTDIFVYKTLQEAGERLQQNFYLNNLALYGMFHQALARERVYRRSDSFIKKHINEKDFENCNLLPEEVVELYQGIGKGEILIAMFKLYFLEHREAYCFDEGVTSSEKGFVSDDYEDISSLTNGLKKRIKRSNDVFWGAKVIPLFFTVQEPLRLSERAKDYARGSQDYQIAEPLVMRSFEKILKDYREIPLSPKEMRKFSLEFDLDAS